MSDTESCLFAILVGIFESLFTSLPCGLVVRIPGFHPGGPGSIPGMGTFFLHFWGFFSFLFPFLLCPKALLLLRMYF